MSMSAREDIMQRIRAALGRGAPLADWQSAAMRETLASHPRGPLPAMDWELLPRFKERAEGLSSTVDAVASPAEVPAAVRRYLSGNALPLKGACWPELAQLPWSGAGLQMQPRPANGEDKVGVTGVYCGIAETGTLMLLSGERTDLATSLLPDTHIAVVRASRIVRSLEDGWDLLRREHGRLPRQVAFVSGPSRTADIEMTLVLGIHGPYRVHIILVA
jgi:L-lactate dehydrogenase complex protein LldG